MIGLTISEAILSQFTLQLLTWNQWIWFFQQTWPSLEEDTYCLPHWSHQTTYLSPLFENVLSTVSQGLTSSSASPILPHMELMSVTPPGCTLLPPGKQHGEFNRSLPGTWLVCPGVFSFRTSKLLLLSRSIEQHSEYSWSVLVYNS